MRTIEEVRFVQTLIEEGLNDCEIARRTGIPRPTIRDWRHGKVPRRGPLGARIPVENSCSECGHPRHDFDALPAREYAYLLGLYLGDGCISANRRGVFRFRVSLTESTQGSSASARGRWRR
jgi:Homeodomain-like domain